MKAFAAVVIFSTLCAMLLQAMPLEGTGGGAAGRQAAGMPASGNHTQTTASTGESLFEKTLPLDIDTASYYELLAWVRRLGVSEKGSRIDLQNRLRQYYKLPTTAVQPQVPLKPSERVITVKSAHSAEYFTLEKVNQKYIRLSGGVDLQMYDPKTDTTHTITADTIVFNQTEKTITATGHIQYLLTGKQKSEVFKGESLTFDVDNWNGIFFQGVSQSQKTIDKNPITFSYSGKTIRRLNNDVVTLNNGTITSSEAIPPNYKITASRIWVLAPGEWALSNAVLYLGHVPIFYFPFFFHPGDNLFFHPSVGYRQEEGYYLQTTTYFLGRRAKANSSLSFLQVSEDTNVTYNTKIRGFFLRKTSPVTAAEEGRTRYDFQKSYVKLLFDIYSRLGVFLGVDSDIVDLGIIKNLQANFSVARSRNIFLNQGAYTQFFQLPDGTFTSLWNSSTLFGTTLPIRYGMDLELNLEAPTFTVVGSMPFYADPYYYRDFSNRSESIDWTRLLGLSGSSTTSSTAAQTAAQTLAEAQTSLLWSLHSTFTPDVSALNPYVSQAGITAADMSMFWQTKTRSVTGVEGLDPNGPNYVPPSMASDYFFPGKQFFYPQSYVLPSVSGRISGTLFSTQTDQAATSPSGGSTTQAPSPAPSSPTQPSQGPTTGPNAQVAAGSSVTEGSSAKPKVDIPPRPPWEKAPKQEPAETPALKVPDIRPDYPVTAPQTLADYSQSLTYSITPAASLEDRTVNDTWLTPADISLSNAYSIFNTRGSGSLTYTGALLGKLFDLQNTTALSGNYKIHYNEVPGITTWQSFLLQDYNATFLKLTNSLTLTSYPFEGTALLAGTNVKYNLVTDLYARNWIAGSSGPSFESSFLTWDSDHVTAHSVVSSIDFSPMNQLQNLNLNVTLPPLVPEIDTKLTDHLGPLTTTVTGSVTRPEGATKWQSQPFTFEGLLTPFSWILLDEAVAYDFENDTWTTSTSKVSLFTPNKKASFTETFTYDMQNGYPTDSLADLKLWFFSMQFETKRTNLYKFALPSGWVSTDTIDFVPANLSMGISYDYKSPYLWKNRIQFATNINSAWNINLLQFTDNSLDLKLDASLSIYKFLDIHFTLQSEDRATYRYIPAFAQQVNQSWLNPLVDLLKSVNIFSTADRTQSNFKMQSVDFKLVHHLGDWDLNLEFTGSPELNTSPEGINYYKWNPTVTLSVDWKPVPEIKSNISVENNQISF